MTPFQEHIIVGVPLIIFFGLIALYLSAQLQLYLVATALITSTITVFCLSLSSWSVLEQSVSYNKFFYLLQGISLVKMYLKSSLYRLDCTVFVIK